MPVQCILELSRPLPELHHFFSTVAVPNSVWMIIAIGQNEFIPAAIQATLEKPFSQLYYMLLPAVELGIPCGCDPCC